MEKSELVHEARDGAKIHVYVFSPSGDPKAVVHVAHGMAEHAARYERFAEALTNAGYLVTADDHRGHGKTSNAADLGYVEGDAFEKMASDLVELALRDKREHPGKKLFLFGHSMGSYLAQDVAITHGAELDGLILSGSAGKPSALASAGRVVARIERARLGPRGKSALLKSMSFDAFNKRFAPNRTSADWLSRDEAEVDKYVADPRCGFECSTSLWVALLDGLAKIADPKRHASIPKSLPVYVFSGALDPVGENTKATDRLLDQYRAAGLKDVSHRYYAGGRHEMLNETNKDEVTRDVIAWLDAHV